MVKEERALIIYIDMDDTLCDYSTAFNEAVNKVPNLAFPQSQYGFYSHLKPIDGAIDGVKHLINSNHFEVYILTAPSTYNPLSYTEKRVWVEKHFGLDFTEKLIICANKGLLKGDVLIDDLIEGKGQEDFEGELIQFGSSKFPNWSAVLAYLDASIT